MAAISCDVAALRPFPSGLQSTTTVVEEKRPGEVEEESQEMTSAPIYVPEWVPHYQTPRTFELRGHKKLQAAESQPSQR